MANRSRRVVESPAGSTMEPTSELTDERWQLIFDLFSENPIGPKGGRPPAPSQDLSKEYSGSFAAALGGKIFQSVFPHTSPAGVGTSNRPRQAFRKEHGLIFTESSRSRWVRAPRRIICGWHVFARKKRGKCVGKIKRGKGTKIMVLIDGHGLSLAAEIASASPHEVTLIEPLLEKRVLRRKSRRLIYDKAGDSDPLRARLADRGIELICPHKGVRRKPPTQDGRKLRRYRRRWKVERSIGWLQNFRRLVVRYERYAHLFHGIIQAACLMVVLRWF